MVYIKITDGWIPTMVLWCWKKPISKSIFQEFLSTSNLNQEWNRRVQDSRNGKSWKLNFKKYSFFVLSFSSFLNVTVVDAACLVSLELKIFSMRIKTSSQSCQGIHTMLIFSILIGHSIFSSQSECSKSAYHNFTREIFLTDTVTMHFGICQLSKY